MGKTTLQTIERLNYLSECYNRDSLQEKNKSFSDISLGIAEGIRIAAREVAENMILFSFKFEKGCVSDYMISWAKENNINWTYGKYNTFDIEIAGAWKTLDYESKDGMINVFVKNKEV